MGDPKPPNPPADLKSALRASPDCPTIEELGVCLQDPSRCAPDIASHIEGCFICKAELELMREFDLAEVRPEEELAVQHISLQLKKKRERAASGAPRRDYRFRTWAAAAACLVLSGASLIYWQDQRPKLTGAPSQSMRGSELRLVAPLGELTATPQQFRWEPVAGATSYRVRLMEVDRTVVWEARVEQPLALIAGAAVAVVAPGRTLLWDVTAYGDGGSVVLSKSQAQSFRVPVAVR